MMMSDADYRGRFLWHELMTVDPDGAQDFYTKVVGWGTQKLDAPGMEYVTWTRGEAQIGGLMELPDEARKHGAPPNWMAYIGTPDVEKTFQQAVESGAEAHVDPREIPGAGHFAVLSDPLGATFAIYTPPAAPPELTGPPPLGDFSWHELVTTDRAAAFDFYQALFGWERTGEQDMGPKGLYQLFGRKGHTLGGMYNKSADPPFPPHWLLYVRVGDIRRAAEAITSAGGNIARGPIEVPGGDWIVQGFDPQGAYFALHQRTTA
jgi:predicted enzyme related to lactoylglutathione lyase